MSHVRIHIAQLSDIADVYAINKACLPIYYSHMEHATMIMDPAHEVSLAKTDDGVVVGYIIGEFYNGNFHICSIGVSEEYRQCGIGTFMIHKLCKRISERCAMVSLNVHVENETAIRFYEKCGFRKVKRQVDYYSELPGAQSLDAFYMVKIINK